MLRCRRRGPPGAAGRGCGAEPLERPGDRGAGRRSRGHRPSPPDARRPAHPLRIAEMAGDPGRDPGWSPRRQRGGRLHGRRGPHRDGGRLRAGRRPGSRRTRRSPRCARFAIRRPSRPRSRSGSSAAFAASSGRRARVDRHLPEAVRRRDARSAKPACAHQSVHLGAAVHVEEVVPAQQPADRVEERHRRADPGRIGRMHHADQSRAGGDGGAEQPLQVGVAADDPIQGHDVRGGQGRGQLDDIAESVLDALRQAAPLRLGPRRGRGTRSRRRRPPRSRRPPRAARDAPSRPRPRCRAPPRRRSRRHAAPRSARAVAAGRPLRRHSARSCSASRSSKSRSKSWSQQLQGRLPRHAPMMPCAVNPRRPAPRRPRRSGRARSRAASARACGPAP